MKGSAYCKTCKLQEDKKENGLPTFSMIDSRISCGMMEYKDPKGLIPKPHSWVIKTLKLTETALESEAERLGVTRSAEGPLCGSSRFKQKKNLQKEEKKDQGCISRRVTVLLLIK